MLWSKEFKRGTKGSTTAYLYSTFCSRKNQKKMLFYADSPYNKAWPTSGPHRGECVNPVLHSNTGDLYLFYNLLFIGRPARDEE